MIRTALRTHNINAVFQTLDLGLEEFECVFFAMLPSEGGRASRVDGVYPVFQLYLRSGLQIKEKLHQTAS